jgi:hypothetical protein
MEVNMRTRSNGNNPMEQTMDSQNRDSQPLNAEGNWYEIRVRGQLGKEWSDWFEGLELRPLEDGEMILFGFIADQAALMGILNKLYRLNLTILSFNKAKEE